MTCRIQPRWSTVGVSSVPLGCYTLATGEIASEERAGEYAIDTFDSRGHRRLLEALARWRPGPRPRAPFSVRDRA